MIQVICCAIIGFTVVGTGILLEGLSKTYENVKRKYHH